MKKLLILGVLAVVTLAVIWRFTPSKAVSTPQTPSEKISVVTSFYPLTFMAQEIGGDRVEVKNLTPAGAEPHDYELTPRDMESIQRSQLLILNGGVEPWGEKVKQTITPNTKVLTVGSELFSQELEEDGQMIKDPHVWLSPALARTEAQAIAAALIDIDPAHANDYTQRAQQLDDKLTALDVQFRTGLAQCAQRSFVTSHDAFGYLASAYNLQQVSIAGLSPDEEPSPRQLADVAKFARQNNVKFIFFESLVSPKFSETVANEVGAKTLVLDPLEGISDADMQSGKNYLTVMQENLANLQIALECTK
jgi:zinc transport system substrate-binding protein